MPRSCHADDAVRITPFQPQKADHCASADDRRGGHCGAARRFVSARLGRRRDSAAVARTQCGDGTIAPAWRGRGASRELLDLHLRRLAGLGIRAVYLEVGEHNAPACRLYRRAGFKEVGRRHGYYDDGASALVLRRDFG
jgi:GNAT superfamily N-acetyltransferase